MTVNDFVIERTVKKEIEYLSLARRKSSEEELPLRNRQILSNNSAKKNNALMYTCQYLVKDH